MNKAYVNATNSKDNLYLTWRIVYSLEDAEAQLFKITADPAGQIDAAIRSPLFVGVFVAIFAATTVLFWSLGSDLLHLIMIGTTALAFIGFACYQRLYRRVPSSVDELQERIELYTDFIRDCQNSLHEISLVPPMYWDSEVLQVFQMHMESGRAGSLLEAIAIYENRNPVELWAAV